MSPSLWFNITAGPQGAQRERKVMKEGAKDWEAEPKQTCRPTKKRVQEESSGRQKRHGKRGDNGEWMRWSRGIEMKEKGGGGRRGEGGGDRVPVCRAERCAAVHHLQTGRQGRLGSLFLPPYKRSLDRLQQHGSTFQRRSDCCFPAATIHASTSSAMYRMCTRWN